MGCRLGQGYHMARPLSAERIIALLVGQQPWNPGVVLPVALSPLATQLH